MDLRNLSKAILPEFRDHPPPGLLDMRRAERQSEPDPLREMLDLLELPRPRYYGRSGHSRVVLCPRAYLEPHALGHERLQVGAGRPGKLVRHYNLDLIRKFTHDRGVELAEQPVDVPCGASTGLVLRGRERYDVNVALAYGYNDAVRDPAYAWGPDLLRIPDPYLPQLSRLLCVGYPDPGHDQRTEVVTLPGLVDAEPRRTVKDGPLSRAGRRSPCTTSFGL